MTDYPCGSHPTWHWTVEALWPARYDDAPTWRAVFFDTSRDGAVRSMVWALDQEDGHLGRALDFRVAAPTLDRPTAGAPWESLPQRRRAAKALQASARRDAERAARVEATPAASNAPDRPTGPARAPRARAADRFRAAARPKKAAKR